MTVRCACREHESIVVQQMYFNLISCIRRQPLSALVTIRFMRNCIVCVNHLTTHVGHSFVCTSHIWIIEYEYEKRMRKNSWLNAVHKMPERKQRHCLCEMYAGLPHSPVAAAAAGGDLREVFIVERCRLHGETQRYEFEIIFYWIGSGPALPSNTEHETFF